MKEIVIVMGINAAGKSTVVEKYVKSGYHRLNRDIEGGTIDGLHHRAQHLLATGTKKLIVLDNTYPTVESRKFICDIAWTQGAAIHCVWLTTSLEEAQMNACLRMIRKTGQLMMPDDFKKTKDPSLFPPAAQYAYRKQFQPPTKAEGFATIEEVPFKRKWGPEYKQKAIILDYDGTLRISTGPKEWPEDVSHVKVLPNRRNRLIEYSKKGYLLLGASNQSAVAKGLDISIVNACFAETHRQLGVDIKYYMFCPHRVPPITCFCRKPSCGMGAYFIETFKLDPSQCIMVGDQTTDKTFAERCGFQYQDQSEFFI